MANRGDEGAWSGLATGLVGGLWAVLGLSGVVLIWAANLDWRSSLFCCIDGVETTPGRVTLVAGVALVLTAAAGLWALRPGADRYEPPSRGPVEVAAVASGVAFLVAVIELRPSMEVGVPLTMAAATVATVVAAALVSIPHGWWWTRPALLGMAVLVGLAMAVGAAGYQPFPGIDDEDFSSTAGLESEVGLLVLGFVAVTIVAGRWSPVARIASVLAVLVIVARVMAIVGAGRSILDLVAVGSPSPWLVVLATGVLVAVALAVALWPGAEVPVVVVVVPTLIAVAVYLTLFEWYAWLVTDEAGRGFDQHVLRPGVLLVVAALLLARAEPGRELLVERLRLVLGAFAAVLWVWLLVSVLIVAATASPQALYLPGIGEAALATLAAVIATPTTALTGRARRWVAHGGAAAVAVAIVATGAKMVVASDGAATDDFGFLLAFGEPTGWIWLLQALVVVSLGPLVIGLVGLTALPGRRWELAEWTLGVATAAAMALSLYLIVRDPGLSEQATGLVTLVVRPAIVGLVILALALMALGVRDRGERLPIVVGGVAIVAVVASVVSALSDVPVAATTAPALLVVAGILFLHESPPPWLGWAVAVAAYAVAAAVFFPLLTQALVPTTSRALIPLSMAGLAIVFVTRLREPADDDVEDAAEDPAGVAVGMAAGESSDGRPAPVADSIPC